MHRLFVPQWWTEDNAVEYISPIGYYLRRIVWFRYIPHPHYKGLLVKINRYTRNRHFEEDMFRKPRFDEVFETLKKFAN